MKRILILIMVLVVSVWAEEIGVPYVEKEMGQVQSAVLAPDGESFYTLKDEYVTHWQLEPIKKLSSFKIKLFEEEKRQKYSMYISSDSKKMVVMARMALLLLDLKKKDLIKRKKAEFYWGIMDGMVFKTTYNKKIVKDNKPIREVVYKEYNIDNLEVTKELSLPYLCNESTHRCSEHYMHYINYMYIYSDKLFVLKLDDIISVLDKKTLKKLDKSWKIWNKCYFTLDKKFFYCLSNNEQYTKINLDTLDAKKIVSKDLVHKKSLHDIYSNISLYKKLSLVFDFDIDEKSASLDFYNNKLNIKIAAFYQFKNDEWILINSDGYFEASRDARQYLKRKTLDGKIAPINDETYEKYNKKIILKG